MDVKEFVESFGALSPEDQAAVLEELGARRSGQPESGCCPRPMKEKVEQMRRQLESSGDPMAMCAELMRLCHEKLSSCSTGGSGTRSWQGGPR